MKHHQLTQSFRNRKIARRPSSTMFPLMACRARRYRRTSDEYGTLACVEGCRMVVRRSLTKEYSNTGREFEGYLGMAISNITWSLFVVLTDFPLYDDVPPFVPSEPPISTFSLAAFSRFSHSKNATLAA